MSAVFTSKGKIIQDPPLARKILNDTRAAWLWLPLRIWLGVEWIQAGYHKLINPAWVQTGDALKGYWQGAVAIPAAPAKPAIAFGWYRTFLQFMLNAQAYTWFAKVITFGEMLVGIGLILGAFVGIAAFFGALMNWNYMMAGSASINPMLFIIAIALVLAWKVAGYVGADYFLLRWLGTPWSDADKQPAAVPQGAPAAEPGLAGTD
jgi:thiosulfate dehydrogenase [quinone] large subunit